MEREIAIKITTGNPTWPLLRQTPGSNGVWNNCHFYVNTNISKCDFWVIYDCLPKKERVACPPQNTIFITAEPPNIRNYEKKFVSQFGHVITCHKNLECADVISSQQALSWIVGAHYNMKENRFDRFSKDYDELKSIEIRKMPKDKILSIVTSHKRGTAGHAQRMKFVEYCKQQLGDDFDIFGSGLNHIGDKWDGLAPYKYCLAIENTSCKDYWTEKISDAFLSGAHPFYFGCTNIHDYFPKDSLTLIDIYNPEKAVEIIKKTITLNAYEKNIESLEKAKNLALDEYNLFPMLAKLCNTLSSKELLSDNKQTVQLKPEKTDGNIVRRTAKRLLGRKNYRLVSEKIKSILRSKPV